MRKKSRTSSMSIQEAFEKFERHCKLKNLSPVTIWNYTYCLRQFSRFHNSDNPVESITQEVVENYILHLKDNTDKNDHSVNNAIRQLRVFCYWLMDQEYIVPFKITQIKADKKIKETYTDAEIQKLLVKPNISSCRFTDLRNWAVVNFLIGTGCRISTAANVKICNLNFNDSIIRLEKTKNRKQQLIPMGRALEKAMLYYLEYREHEYEDDWLFPNQFGEKITPNAIRIAIRDYNINRGVTKTSCHLFRHTYTKNWILSGGDIFRLQKILGHSTLDMVKEYSNIYGHDLQDNFEQFNLLDRLSNTKQTIKAPRYQKGGKR